MKKQKNERISLKNYKKRLQTRFLLCIILIKQGDTKEIDGHICESERCFGADDKIFHRAVPEQSGENGNRQMKGKVDAYGRVAGACGRCHVGLADSSGAVAVPKVQPACQRASVHRQGGHRKGQRTLPSRSNRAFLH